ncbi:putative U6 snRNA-associated Sm-like protein LSm4 [Tritrichomonas foetus]|uniref:U6 snRNA-associated Sm-like protein LSm4 n=1 Tax=Tritrichomonas foetus TaxID=1144522 RepID=A0A1J4IZQ1_9EUKA|nr:putative U6 snRNA-associated Sm-like protein LSm4 [Tritrichomonas foetus]|eukprot:OHS92832.1 putative U6 snRNA-associated Sm-like protein LSm4 [Tritrichomonas foetus]
MFTKHNDKDFAKFLDKINHRIKIYISEVVTRYIFNIFNQKFTTNFTLVKIMFPLDYLQASSHYSVEICLKNGDTYSGILEECDKWMNFVLSSATLTTHDGKESQLERAMIRGNSVRSISMPKAVIEAVKERKTDSERTPGNHWRRGRGNYRGGRGGGPHQRGGKMNHGK